MRIKNRQLFLREEMYNYMYIIRMYCEVFEYEFENNIGIMGWFERIIGGKFGNKRIE